MGPGAGALGRLLLTVPLALALSTGPPGSWGARIIGGHEVTPHSRPYMVSVKFGGQHQCGGFLLRARWVVSAAHCFSDRDPRVGLVVLGAHVLRTSEPTQQVFGISAVIRHPDYQPATHANDICLLQGSSPQTPPVPPSTCPMSSTADDCVPPPPGGQGLPPPRTCRPGVQNTGAPGPAEASAGPPGRKQLPP